MVWLVMAKIYHGRASLGWVWRAEAGWGWVGHGSAGHGSFPKGNDMEFELPFPPSTNHMWRRVGNRTLISRGGRAFRAAVCSILAAARVRPLDGPLDLVIDVFPPDRRRRDIDNLQKALLDALAHGGAYHDDSQVARLTIQRRHVVPGGKVCVRIESHREERTDAYFHPLQVHAVNQWERR